MVTLKQLDKEKIMEDRDFALAVVNSLLSNPNQWKMQAEEYRWISTVRAVASIMGAELIIAGENSLSSETRITVFPRPKLVPKIYGICRTLNDPKLPAARRSSWFFVVQGNASLEWVLVPKQTVEVDDCGNLTVEYDDRDHTFKRDHPAWPWPGLILSRSRHWHGSTTC